MDQTNKPTGDIPSIERVVFDTNAYRNFVTKKSHSSVRADVLRLNQAEEKAGIISLLSVVVMTELFKHLLDKTDVNYQDCKLAVVAAIFHCGKRLGEDHSKVPYVPIWEKILYYELTGEYRNAEEETWYERSIVAFGTDIAFNPSDEKIAGYEETFSINKANFQSSKRSLFEALSAGLSVVEPGATFLSFLKKDKLEKKKFLGYINSEAFEYNLSQIFLESIKAKHNLPQPITSELLDRFVIKYRPLIQLHRQLYTKLINGIKIVDENHKEFNSFYDSFVIAASLLFENCVCVTNEKQLIECFAKTGRSEQVMTLDQYLAKINYS